MTDEIKTTCTLPDCQFCNDLNPEKAVEYFISESNLIEGITDPAEIVQSLHAWKYLIEEPKLTGGAIQKVQKIITLHQKNIRPNERGYWRTSDVKIGFERIVGITPDGNGLIKEYVKTGEGVEWRHIPDLIKLWLERTAKVKTDEEIKKAHIEFEHIHPFIDGNGRAGRMVLNWQRLKAGLPLLIIHDENKKDYYQWFKV